MNAVRANRGGSSKCSTLSWGSASAAMVPRSTMTPYSGLVMSIAASSPAATVSTRFTTRHGATSGRISMLGASPTAPGVATTSIRLLLMMMGDTGPSFSPRSRVIHRRSSMITSPSMLSMPESLIWVARSSSPAKGSLSAIVAPGRRLASLWSMFVKTTWPSSPV